MNIQDMICAFISIFIITIGIMSIVLFFSGFDFFSNTITSLGFFTGFKFFHDMFTAIAFVGSFFIINIYVIINKKYLYCLITIPHILFLFTGLPIFEWLLFWNTCGFFLIEMNKEKLKKIKIMIK